MKERNKICIGATAVLLLLVGLVTSTVSAATWGDAYTAGGFNLGYVLIIGAIILFILARCADVFSDIQKPLYVVAVIVVNPKHLAGGYRIAEHLQSVSDDHLVAGDGGIEGTTKIRRGGICIETATPL